MAALAGCLAAGPWPALGPLSLAWRVPLVVAGLAIGWRGLGRVRWALATLALAALALDGVVTNRADVRTAASALGGAVAREQQDIGRAAGDAGLHRVLIAGGAEARPEQPFEALAAAMDDVPGRWDAAVLVDERGAPVAWLGDAPALPLRLRTLGERAVGVEAGLDSVWLWWREPIFEAGRAHGALLVGLAVPERGVPQLLGVWGGRSAVLVPRLAGGATVAGPGGDRLMGLDIEAAPPVFWSASAGAAFAAALLLGACGLAVPVGLAGMAPTVAFAGPWLAPAWLVVMAVSVLAWAIPRLGSSRWGRASGALVVASAGVGISVASRSLGASFAIRDLLWPGLLSLALTWALALLAHRAPRQRGAPFWPIAAVGWLVIAAATARAEVGLLALGVGIITAWGRPRRGAAVCALLAALQVVVSQDGLERQRLVAEVDTTLGRLQGVNAAAGSVLGALPQSGLDELVTLAPREQLVVLGRLARWFDLERLLPGCSVTVVSSDGYPLATWGEVPPPREPARVLARREIAGGDWIEVIAPPPPHELLAALATALDRGPVAVIGRSGAPIGRGATFRPLSSNRVGLALARGQSWGTVGVGERDLPTYLRSWGDVVVAVPWVRRPLAETLLLLTALTLWGLLPLTVAGVRAGWRSWWSARRSLTGRLRALSVGIVLLPLLLLGYLLPRQWSRQTERARLDLARVVSEPLSRAGWDHDLGWLVRDLGGVVTVYRAGVMVLSTHPDQVVRGEVPWLAPQDSYVRAVRGWFEPVVQGDRETRVFTAVPEGDVPTVVAVTGLRQAAAQVGSSPGEWFVVTGFVGLLLALAAARRLGERIAVPLQRLLDAARRVERGETVERIDAPPDAEMEVLARAFETMARTVRGREEELRRERDLLGEVLRTLSAAVAVWRTEDASVELANPAASALLGADGSLIRLEERFGDPFSALTAAARQGGRATAILRPLRGQDSLWRVTVVPLTGQRALLVMEDLSDVARAERLASLAELARIVAHEVKNPLTPIRLWAEELEAALERGPDAVVEVARVAADQILGRVRHLHDVAQGFSNLVALEHWQPESVEAGELARDVIAEYGVLGQRGIEVGIRAAEDTRIMVDAQWLRRALRHLLENSVRAIGQRRGTISVEVVRNGDDVEISVRDTGGGVPDEHVSRLFEPHFSTTSDGSGLGLAVVARVAHRAGGGVDARNTENGLEVRLRIPAAAARR